MTSQSPDLFLEKASYVVMYLEDGIVAVYIDRDTRGKVFERSDLLTCSRSRHSEEEQAVVLGFGETAREATKSAKEYWRRVCRIHDEEVTELFGHDVRKVKEMSQVDIFFQSDAESSQDPDSSDSSCSPPVKRRMTRSLARNSRGTE